MRPLGGLTLGSIPFNLGSIPFEESTRNDESSHIRWDSGRRNSCVGSNVDPILLFDHEGNVWVTDAWRTGATTTGHSVLKFSPEGELLMTIGTPGEAGDPPTHLTQPSDVLVAPNFLAIWTQFGRPSGLYIDGDDNIYVADSESSPAPNEFTGQRNAGWEKGIRIGDARNGWVHHFLPDDRANVMGFSGPEGVAVDREGNVYGAEVSQRRITKWVRFRR